jgi:Family of unknown function (DUF6082)
MAKDAITGLTVNQHSKHVIRRVLFTVTALVAAAAFTVGTPFLLLTISHIRPSDWTELSSEAQTYGGVAAVFGMLALVGVAGSLILQSREIAASRELAQRTIHTDLLSRALHDPKLNACWGPSLHGDADADRQHLYTNMIVQFWHSMFEIGKITEDQLHALSAQLFRGMPGRRYWSIAGPFQKSHYLTETDRRFMGILDEEHTRQAARAVTNSRSKFATLPKALTDNRSAITTLTLGLVTGAVLSTVARRRSKL